VRASWIEGRVVLATSPDGDAYTLSASEARKRGLKNKFGHRMGDDYRFRNVGKCERGALVMHRESLKAAQELFEALAQNRPGYLKALLYPMSPFTNSRRVSNPLPFPASAGEAS
jgi:L-iditol 2-dehydrogenase